MQGAFDAQRFLESSSEIVQRRGGDGEGGAGLRMTDRDPAEMQTSAVVRPALRAVGVNEMTKVCDLSNGMSTGVFGVPVSWFVAGSVVW